MILTCDNQFNETANHAITLVFIRKMDTKKFLTNTLRVSITQVTCGKLWE